MTIDFDLEEMRERFVKRVYKDSMDDALPIVQKAYKMKKENKFTKQFESWANTVAESWDEAQTTESIDVAELANLIADEFTLGVDGMNAIAAIRDIINNDGLEKALTQAAAQDPDADAREIIISWVYDNAPATYQELVSDYGDQDTPDQYSEGNTYGSGDGGMNGTVYEQENEADSTDAIATAIIRRILNGCSTGDAKCLALLRKLGPEGVTNAAVDIAEFAGPVDEIGSSDVSGWVAQIARDAGIEHEVAEADTNSNPLRKTASPSKKAKDAKYYDYLARTLSEESGEEYCDACDSVECKCDELDEAVGNDYVNKDEKLKRMGAKPLSILDKAKIMPSQAKSAIKGDSEDDLLHYNKIQSNLEEDEVSNDEDSLSEMRRLAGLG